MSRPKTWRLNPTDEMLHEAARVLGSSRIVQVLWRFPTPVPTASLEAAWHRLNQGRLSRVPAVQRVPGARRRWAAATNREPLQLTRQPLAEAEVAEWIDTQVRAPLPVGSDALWRLAAAPYQGGSLVSLTVPHFRCDGLGLFHAIASVDTPADVPDERRSLAALLGSDPNEHCSPAALFGSGLGDLGLFRAIASVDTSADIPNERRSSASLLGSDLGDALGQTVGALVGATRLSISLLIHPRERRRIGSALRRSVGPAPASFEPRFFTSTIVEVSAAQWEERARAHGGTVNSLFVEIAANLVRSRAPREEQAPVQVGVPMSLRGAADDGRANALIVVPLTLPGGAAQHTDLQQTRHTAKTALAGVGARSATLVPEALWHRLPARHADRLKAPGAQQTDVVASNFGQVPNAVVRFADCTADSVVLRTMNVPGVVPERARLRASLCLLQVGDTMTVTATAMPDHFGDAESLYRLVADEFGAWGLTTRPWHGGPTSNESSAASNESSAASIEGATASNEGAAVAAAASNEKED